MNHADRDQGEAATELRVRLELASLPTSVTLIRSLIRTLARAADLRGALLDDLRTAASEACNNVVLHAYPAGPGPLIFSLLIRADVVEVVVRDRGCGIRPNNIRSRGLGMGVVLINSLADHVEFSSDSDHGTEVRMSFARPTEVPEPLGRLSVGVWALAGAPTSDALPARSG